MQWNFDWQDEFDMAWVLKFCKDATLLFSAPNVAPQISAVACCRTSWLLRLKQCRTVQARQPRRPICSMLVRGFRLCPKYVK